VTTFTDAVRIRQASLRRANGEGRTSRSVPIGQSALRSLPSWFHDLVRRKVAVIVTAAAIYGTGIQVATSTIPMSSYRVTPSRQVSSPVSAGRGQPHGVSSILSTLMPKQIALLERTGPKAS